MEEVKPTPTAPTASTAPMPSGPKYPLAALAYFPPLLFIITILQKGKDPAHLWHAKNGAGLLILSLIIFILSGYIFGGILLWLGYILDLLYVGLVLFGAYKAYSGVMVSLPGLSSWAQKIPLEKWFKLTEAGPMPAPKTETEAAMPTPPIEPLVSTPTVGEPEVPMPPAEPTPPPESAVTAPQQEPENPTPPQTPTV